MKIPKPAHAFKGCASTYDVEVLSFCNHEVQLKDYKSAIKKELTKLLSELRV